MKKLVFAPIMILLACIVASCIGIVQDLLTYQISNSWYHDWKFQQFGVPEAYHGPIGAAWVGVGATWWMGLILSIPVLAVSWFAKDARTMVGTFMIATLIVAMSTIVIEGVEAVRGAWAFTEDTVPAWALRHYPLDSIGAACVQSINWTGYFVGAPIGLLLALIYAVRQVRAV